MKHSRALRKRLDLHDPLHPDLVDGVGGRGLCGTWAPRTSRGEMGLGPQRNSVSLAVAVATCAPRPPDVPSAGEGVVDVGAAAAALCVKSRTSASSNSTDLSDAMHRMEKISSSGEPLLASGGKRHCGVGGRSGGRPGASGAPGVLVMANSNSRHNVSQTSTSFWCHMWPSLECNGRICGQLQ